MPVQDVKIAYHEPWVKHHIHAMQSVYGKTAFGDEVLPPVFECIAAHHATLWALNESLLLEIIEMLPGLLQYSITTTYTHVVDDRVFDLRSGIPAGMVDRVKASVPTYPQVQRLHLPFQANLTILDVLCHLGPQSLDYLSRYAANLYAHS